MSNNLFNKEEDKEQKQNLFESMAKFVEDKLLFNIPEIASNVAREGIETVKSSFPQIKEVARRSLIPYTTVLPGLLTKQPFETGLTKGLLEEASFNALPPEIFQEFVSESMKSTSDYKEGQTVGKLLGTAASFMTSSKLLGATKIPSLINKLPKVSSGFINTLKTGAELGTYSFLRKQDEAKFSDITSRLESGATGASIGLAFGVAPPIIGKSVTLPLKVAGKAIKLPLKAAGKALEKITNPIVKKLKNTSFETMNKDSVVQKLIQNIKDEGIDISGNLVKKVSNGRTTNPMQLNIAEFQSMYNSLLTTQGKKVEKQVFNILKKSAIDSIKAIPKKEIKALSKPTGLAKKYWLEQIRPQRFMEELDQGKYGIHSLVFDKLYYSNYNALDAYNKSLNMAFSSLKGNSKLARNLNKTLKLPSGKTMTRKEAITTYMGALEEPNKSLINLKNVDVKSLIKASNLEANAIRTGVYKGQPITGKQMDFLVDSMIRKFPAKEGHTYVNDTLEVLNKGMGLTKDDITFAIKDVINNPEVKGLADNMVKTRQVVGRLYRNVFSRLTGKRISPKTNWLNIKKQFKEIGGGEVFNSNLDELNSVMAKQGTEGLKRVAEQFSKHRPMKYNIKIETDAIKNFMYNTQRMTDFIYKSDSVNMAKHVMNDAWKNEVSKKYGSEFVNAIVKNVNSMSSPAVTDNFKTLSTFANWARRNSSTYVLGLKIPTMMKQPVSILNAIPHIGKAGRGETYLLDSLGKVMSGKQKPMHEFMLKSSSVMRNRFIERDLAERAARTKTQEFMGKGIKGKIDEFAMKGLRAFDRFSVTLVWTSKYMEALARTGSHKEAIRLADGVIRRTQPISSALDLPLAFKGGELSKAFTAFKNQLNQNLNIAKDLSTQYKNLSSGEIARRILYQFVVPMTAISAISSGGNSLIKVVKDRKVKDFATDAALYMVAPFPVFGDLIGASVKGFDFSPIVFKPIQAAQEFLKTKDPSKRIKSGIKLAGLIRGLPLDQPLKTIKGAIDLHEGSTESFRRLIFSEFSLGKERKKKRIRTRTRKRKKKITFTNIFG